MIEDQLQGSPLRSQEFHKQGANGAEVVEIQKRLAEGQTPEKISSDMMICLECVESFVGKESDASNFKTMVAERQASTGVVEVNLDKPAAAKPAKGKKKK